MVKAFICLGLVLFSGLVSGQDQSSEDSLSEVLQSRVRVGDHPTLYHTAIEYVDVNNEVALKFIEHAVEDARTDGDSAAI